MRAPVFVHWALLTASILKSTSAAAQPHPADAGACEALASDLEASRREAARARSAVAATERKVAACETELASTSTQLRQSTEATKVCEDGRAHVCSTMGAFADDIARGRTGAGIESGCVSTEQQARLDAVLNGWSGATTWLSQLASYQSGETDSLPRARAGSLPIDRLVQRIARNGGGRALHRRLLVEALETVAPQAWTRIRAGGMTGIDAWFSTSDALGPEIASEVDRVQSSGISGPAGPPLTAALHLVRAFKVAAHCDPSSTEANECLRARQLEQLLESSGSLVVRRRIEEIWSRECMTLAPETISGWIDELPTAHGAAAKASWREIAENAYAKLFACYLDDASEHTPYGTWLKEILPAANALTSARLERVDAIRAQWDEGSREAKCARAVRAMQTLAVPATCSVPGGDFLPAVDAWAAASGKLDDAGMPLAMCAQFAQLLWEGKAASIDGSFARPPSLDEMVVAKPMPPTPMWRLREHCEERGGNVSFPDDVALLGSLASRFGEAVEKPPFRLDPTTRKPVELVRFEASQGAGPWFSHVARGVSACSVLGLSDERCEVCSKLAPTAVYDCQLVDRLETSWSERTRLLILAGALWVLVILGTTWLRRLVRARRQYLSWARDTAMFFEGIGLSCRADRWRILFPSRHDTLAVMLPSEPAWERWGRTAAIVRVPPGHRVLERDVNHAAFVARRVGASVALLEHDDGATPDLSAVRAMLEWAAKGGSRATQILPIGVSRARWSKSAHDVLDLVEESSLRGNPFELRGRIATSTQFFNRERLVSGLLAAAQAGHWMVVTGLRRFGKSSLALEVARRVPGPSAYVDLAGFDYEIVHENDPSVAADAILRFVCLRLAESARERWPSHDVPAPPGPDAAMDAAGLTRWLRDFSRACRAAAGRTTTVLVVLDEMEQALDVGPDKLAHALDVLAIVIGRLKSAVGDAAMPDGGSPIGVFLTSALHPLLWAPLRTLAHQSIMGSFQRVCVPCLSEDAATTMMRSLGARQGIRFTDEALARIVADSQGVPLLLRRMGASILELYDAERARQGSLGAVEVGIEGTTEAIQREGREGSPLRVWIETEIAGRSTVPGALLRRLARAELVSVVELCSLAKQRIAEDFERTGVSTTL
ncbi:MAG TPA: ATP-binding protein, partial [Labilithrix sp.]|nr:ATP-binding protein [Labilithrix sp.]